MRGKAGVFDVSHMGQVETSGPQAPELLQRLLSNDVGRIEVGGAQYSVLCREDGGVLDDLFTYRLGEDRYPDRHQRRQPREGLRLDVLPGRVVRRRGGRSRRRLRDARRPGPDRTRDRPVARRRAAARAHAGGASASSTARRDARVRHGLHRRGRRRAAAGSRARGPRCGTGCSTPAPCPPVWPPATPCAPRSASRSTATISARSAARSRPVWAGAARRTRASSAPTPSARCAQAGPQRGSSRSSSRARASRARATPWSAAAR